jgi:hypothetical protein
MTPFPPIQRLCPHLDRLDEVIDAGFCRMCRHEVHDLTGLDEGGRRELLATRGAGACVCYRRNVTPAVAAALIAASTAVLAAPDTALASTHQPGRGHHRQRQIQIVPVVTAGLIVPVQVDPPRDPAAPRPTQPPRPPQKPD